jgi:galactokinase
MEPAILTPGPDTVDLAEIKQRFAALFDGERGDGAEQKTHVIRAPGRVNLIGEHTDYNDGFVFPMAIEPQVTIVCRAREDGRVRLGSTAFPGALAEFSVREQVTRGEPKWANYNRGVAAQLQAGGIPLVGMDALLSNTLPVGGGLSSSAAIEVGTAVAMLKLAGRQMGPSQVALLCQKAEHEFAGVPVGIMDQMIVACGRPGHAMLLDCRDLSRRFIPIDPHDLRVVIVNSMVKHELSGGEYAQRRRQCEEGVEYFKKDNPQVKALRDVDMAQVESARGKLPDVVWRRCRHVVGENARTTAAAAELAARHYDRVGKFMLESHASLRDDYEVSVEELDFLVEQSMKVPGVYGARMTGGGFGGCIVALVAPEAVEPLSRHLCSAYRPRYDKEPAIYVTTATAGAGEVPDTQ